MLRQPYRGVVGIPLKWVLIWNVGQSYNHPSILSTHVMSPLRNAKPMTKLVS